MRKAAIVTATMLAIGTASAASPLKKCDGHMVMTHYHFDAHTQLSGAVLGAVHVGDGIRGVTDTVEVYDCQSDYVASATFFRGGESKLGSQTALDQIRNFTRANGTTTIWGIAQELSAMSDYVFVRKMRQESCACAVMFPELRGDTEPFDMSLLVRLPSMLNEGADQ